MFSFRNYLLFGALGFFCISCVRAPEMKPTENPEIGIEEKPKLERTEYERTHIGKIKNAKEQARVFVESHPDTLEFPVIDEKLKLGLERQLKLLEMAEKRKSQYISGLSVPVKDLKRTVEILLKKAESGLRDYHKDLSAFQIWGDDKKGHVEFTGYFTPVLDVKKYPDSTYKFPLYRKPKTWSGRMPSRRQIDGEGVLAGRGLEICYGKNLLDIYYMQVQGSGYVNFLDTGEKKLLRFGGKNGHSYSDIETFIRKNVDLGTQNVTINGIKKYLRANPDRTEWILFYNPSYVFFNPSKTKVRGAGGVTLIEDISIATDPKYLPLGSVVLASVPVYNERSKMIGHEFRILLPQDTGGAIRGPGHVDVYSGVGREGKIKASARNHYGQMWILLPKEVKDLALLEI